MTPEESQKITDYRRRILVNVQEGKPPHEGFTPEELSEGLAILRQNRIVGASRGGKASGTAKAATKAAKEAKGASSMEEKLKALGLNLD